MAIERLPDAPADLGAAALRKKYLDLCRKYAELVERLEKRARRHSAAFQLGRWGVEMRSAALAMIVNGRIELCNVRFNELAQIKGEWQLADGAQHRQSTLRTLLVDEAKRVMQEREERTVRVRNQDRGMELSVHTELNRRGSQTVVLAILEDVTDEALREEEISQSRDALLQRERVRVLGLLAAAVAHDLGSTLRGASYQLASLRPFGFRDRAGALQGAMERLEVASEIVARLHDFARTGAEPPAGPVRLARVLQKAIGVANLEKTVSGQEIKVVTSIPELPPVRGNEAELSLLFVNLLLNARDAMPRGGAIQVHARWRPSGAVRVTVADEGTGIPHKFLRRLFTPFFTTKGNNGSGLGLWLAKGTMARLGGSITVSNRREGGAMFVIELPVMVSPSGPRLPRVRAAPALPAARKPRRAPRNGRRS
jgi:signal transduction histidine kinase